MLVDGHFGVEVPALDAGLSAGGQEHLVEGFGIVGGVLLCALGAGGGSVGLGQGELLIVGGGHVVARGEVGARPAHDSRERLHPLEDRSRIAVQSLHNKVASTRGEDGTPSSLIEGP